MTRRRNHKKPKTSSAIREEQLEALIPGGGVNEHRGRRDKIAFEVRSATERGTPVIVGQVVSTPVRRLLEAGHITLQMASAAWSYEYDRDKAYPSQANILASVHVDGGGDSGDAADRRLHHSRRFHAANARLGELGTSIAAALILGRHPNITAVGAELLPGAPTREQQAAGKGALAFVLRHLHAIYTEKAHPKKVKGKAA